MRLNKLFFYYCFFVAIFITISTATLGLQTGNSVLFLLFLPVIYHFVNTLFRKAGGIIHFFVIYYCFVIVTIMAVMGFIEARAMPLLISAILFSPLTAYFWLLVFPKRTKEVVVQNITRQEPITPELMLQKKTKYDIDRRMFIKLIGSAGLTLFFLSIFTRKAEAAFFGSVPGPGTVTLKDTTGTQIDPAIKTPTDGYKITNIDDSSPAYYGFVDRTGKWYIMKEDTTTGSYRYTKGSSSFSTNWTNRASLPYDYFNIIFP